MKIEFFAQGIPKGQPRPKAFSRGGFTRVYDPGTAEGWKGQIALAAKPHLHGHQFTTPVLLDIDFYFPRPKNHYRSNGKVKENAPYKHVTKPDVDNCVKAVMDALTQLGVWKDDSLVYSIEAVKWYCDAEQKVCGAGIKISD